MIVWKLIVNNEEKRPYIKQIRQKMNIQTQLKLKPCSKQVLSVEVQHEKPIREVIFVWNNG